MKPKPAQPKPAQPKLAMRPAASLQARGFSLMEVLVAIAIFAVVAGISYSTLDRYIEQREFLANHYGKLEKLQRLFILLERDFQSIANRTIRNGNSVYGAIEQTPDLLIAMTISEPDYSSGAGVAMKRVEWSLDGDELIRKVWGVLDTEGDYEPIEQVISTQVEDMQLDFLYYSRSTGVQTSDNLQGYPDGISLLVVLESGVEYTRFFAVAKP